MGATDNRLHLLARLGTCAQPQLESISSMPSRVFDLPFDAPSHPSTKQNRVNARVRPSRQRHEIMHEMYTVTREAYGMYSRS